MIKYIHSEQAVVLYVVKLFEVLSRVWPFRVYFCRRPLGMICRKSIVKSIDRLWNYSVC